MHTPPYLYQLNKSPHVAATYDQEANGKEEKEETQAGIHTEWHLKQKKEKKKKKKLQSHSN